MSTFNNHGLQVFLGLREVGSIRVTNPGSGYTTATVSITGGGGSSATATATIDDGEIIEIVVDDPGSGFTSVPTVTITGDGSGATATASLLSKVGQLTAVSGISFSSDTEEVTTYDSEEGFKEYFPVLLDSGDFTLEVLAADQSFLALEQQVNRRVMPLEVYFPDEDETILKLTVQLTSFELNSSNESVARVSLTFKRVTGAPIVP